jgi:hypothetical protein
MPYDTVTVQGFYRSQPEVNDAITKAAKAKGAYRSLSCARLMPTRAATSALPPISTKKMRKTRSAEPGRYPG